MVISARLITRIGLLLVVTSAVVARPVSRFDVRKTSPPPVAVKGKPYSGTLLSESTGVQPDGARILLKSVLRTEYRDSQGRTRIEKELPSIPKDPLRIITIDDPAARAEYVLEPKKKIAHRFTFKESTTNPSTAPRTYLGPPDGPGLPKQTEILGTEMIQGMAAEGVRETRWTYGRSPDGESVPQDVVTDTWTATDLQAVILERTAGQNGETNTRMTDLRLEEQPASLFQVPPDYRMEDELNDFFIEYPAGGRTWFPEVISRVDAKYTAAALNSGIQGKVLVAATVDESGRPREVHVEESLDPGLDQEAVKAVSQWRFKPATEDGRPVRMTVTVEVKFGLN